MEKTIETSPAEKKKRGCPLWVKIVVPIVIVLLIAGLAFYLHLRNMISGMLKTDNVGEITSEVVQTAEEYQGDYLNLLIVGIDYDEGDTLRDYGSPEDANTDLIMYVHYDVKHNKMNVLQIPRDSYIGDSTVTGKINGVFAEGADRKNPISNLAKVINEDFGLPVDSYITVDMAAFKEIIDVFGGMNMTLPWDIYAYDENGDEILVAPAGDVRVNGDTAELIVRARKQYATQDLQRLQLQQYVYLAMYKLMKTASLPDMYNYVLPIVTYRIKSDLDYNTFCKLAGNLLKLKSSDIFFVRVPGGGVSVNGYDVYGVDAAALVPILNKNFLAEGSTALTESDLSIPTGWTYPHGEIIEEGRTMSDLETDTAANSGSSSDTSSSPAADFPAA